MQNTAFIGEEISPQSSDQNWLYNSTFTKVPNSFIREYGNKIKNFRDRWVYLLLIDSAIGRQKQYAQISLRQIASLAGCSLDSARTSITRLTEMGLISVHKNSTSNQATTYALQRPTESTVRKTEIVNEIRYISPQNPSDCPSVSDEKSGEHLTLEGGCVRSLPYSLRTVQNVQLKKDKYIKEKRKEEEIKEISESRKELRSSHLCGDNDFQLKENSPTLGSLENKDLSILEEQATLAYNDNTLGYRDIARGAGVRWNMLTPELKRAYSILVGEGMAPNVFFDLVDKGVKFDPEYCCKATVEHKTHISTAMQILQRRKLYRGEFSRLKTYFRYQFYANRDIIDEINTLLRLAYELKRPHSRFSGALG